MFSRMPSGNSSAARPVHKLRYVEKTHSTGSPTIKMASDLVSILNKVLGKCFNRLMIISPLCFYCVNLSSTNKAMKLKLSSYTVKKFNPSDLKQVLKIKL